MGVLGRRGARWEWVLRPWRSGTLVDKGDADDAGVVCEGYGGWGVLWTGKGEYEEGGEE